MNKIRKVPILAATLALAASLTACQTATQVTPPLTAGGTPTTNTVTTFLGQVVTPAGLYSQFRGGTAQAALIALRSDPNSLAYLQGVQQVLNATIESGSYNPTTLSNALASLPSGAIHNPQALEAIQSGFVMFEIIAPLLQNGVNGQNPFIVPALQGIADGIGDALSLLQQTAPAPAAAPAAVAKPAPAPAPTPAPAPAATTAPAAAASTNAPPTADTGK